VAEPALRIGPGHRGQRDSRHATTGCSPGDVQQFAVGGLGLAYGAAGCSNALDVTGGGRHPQFETGSSGTPRRRPAEPVSACTTDCTARPSLSNTSDTEPKPSTSSTYLPARDWESLGRTWPGGLAGVGLNLLHFAEHTGESALRDAAHRAAELVGAR